MLNTLNQFMLELAIRKPMYFSSPIIISSGDVRLPKYSVYHCLDYSGDTMTPPVDLPYLSVVDKIKRIPIHHVMDLLYKTDTTSLANTKAASQIKRWNSENIRRFRSMDLIETPNKTPDVISLVNYNPIVSLYRYRESLLVNHHRYMNTYGTLFATLKRMIEVDSESVHFVPVDLPAALPSVKIIDTLLTYNDVKFTRVVSNPALRLVITIYRWVMLKHRESSAMRALTDEDSKHLIFEFRYKGYSCLMPLHVLRGMSKDSELISESKMDPWKVAKIYMGFLFKLQENVELLIEANVEDTESGLDEAATELELFGDATDDETPTRDDEGDHHVGEVSELTERKSLIAKMRAQRKRVDEASNANMSEDSIEEFFDKQFRHLEDMTGDSLYLDTMMQVENEVGNDDPEEQVAFEVNPDPAHVESLLQKKTLRSSYELYMKEASSFKLLSAAERRNLKLLMDKRDALTSPYDPKVALDTYKTLTAQDTELTEQEVKIPHDVGFVEPELLKDPIRASDRKYVSNILHKDIVACVSDLESAGVVIKDYTVARENSALGAYEIHRITIKPLNGRESICQMRLPVITDEGEFTANGIAMRMRRQETDLPIRKISLIEVALTSNFGKLFVSRSARKTHDPYVYVTEYVKARFLEADPRFKAVEPGNSYNCLAKLPNDYTMLGKSFRKIQTDQHTFVFNKRETLDFLDAATFKELDAKGLVCVGHDTKKSILVIQHDNIVYDYTQGMAPLGRLLHLIVEAPEKIPLPMSMLSVLGDNIPLGVVFGYHVGLNNLIAITGASHQVLGTREHYSPKDNEVVLRFVDHKLVVTCPNEQTKLLFAGFTFFKDFIKKYTMNDFNHEEIYLDLFDFRGFGLVHIKQIRVLEELFLDSITVDVLRTMGEPTEYLKLLLRANEMLGDFGHPEVNDPAYTRIRGYDRVPGLMYRALSTAVRNYKFKGNARAKIELDPYEVWNTLLKDNTVKICEDINPILDVKEMEAVTLTGTDGLSKGATPVALRRYHKNDIGLISESTVDSGDVALNIYLSPYAKFKNVRGMVDMSNTEAIDTPAKIFSTSTLLAPGSEHDD